MKTENRCFLHLYIFFQPTATNPSTCARTHNDGTKAASGASLAVWHPATAQAHVAIFAGQRLRRATRIIPLLLSRPCTPLLPVDSTRCAIRIQSQVASQQPHAGFPTAPQAYYYPYLYSWPSWPPAQQPSSAAPPHTSGLLSRETASKQLLDMGLPAFSSMAMAGKQQTTMQSSLTNGPHKSGSGLPQPTQPQDPYLTRLLQPPPRRQVWSSQPRSAWRAPQPTQSKPAAKVLSSQHAPGPPPVSPPPITTNPRAIKDALGADVYNHFRDVLLRQQETVTFQVCGVLNDETQH